MPLSGRASRVSAAGRVVAHARITAHIMSISCAGRGPMSLSGRASQVSAAGILVAPCAHQRTHHEHQLHRPWPNVPCRACIMSVSYRQGRCPMCALERASGASAAQAVAQCPFQSVHHECQLQAGSWPHVRIKARIMSISCAGRGPMTVSDSGRASFQGGHHECPRKAGSWPHVRIKARMMSISCAGGGPMSPSGRASFVSAAGSRPHVRIRAHIMSINCTGRGPMSRTCITSVSCRQGRGPCAHHGAHHQHQLRRPWPNAPFMGVHHECQLQAGSWPHVRIRARIMSISCTGRGPMSLSGRAS